MRSIVCAGLALLAAAATAGAVRAEEPSAPLKVKSLSPDGQDACFGRVYDAGHLNSHPKQKVSRIFFYYGKDPVSHPDEEPPGSNGSYDGFLTTTIRGAKKPEWISGWCGADDDETPGKIHCGMDCDRSLANLMVDDKDRLHLKGLSPDVYLDPDAEDELGKAEYARQSLGADDDDFTLDRMPAQQCRAEFGRIDPADPTLGAPLRERFKPDQPFCFGRDYDARHMSSHPKQVTTTIRVSRGATEIASYAATNKAENWPNGSDLKVSVTTRSKASTARRAYKCAAVGDTWECTAAPEAVDGACKGGERTIFLKRGANGVVMLSNPNGGLPIVDLCGAEGGAPTRSDDKVYRLQPMDQAACER